jgi:hypothetical protein
MESDAHDCYKMVTFPVFEIAIISAAGIISENCT